MKKGVICIFSLLLTLTAGGGARAQSSNAAIKVKNEKFTKLLDKGKCREIWNSLFSTRLKENKNVSLNGWTKECEKFSELKLDSSTISDRGEGYYDAVTNLPNGQIFVVLFEPDSAISGVFRLTAPAGTQLDPKGTVGYGDLKLKVDCNEAIEDCPGENAPKK